MLIHMFDGVIKFMIMFLQVDISDALSEKDKVKFTVHTRTGKNSL